MKHLKSFKQINEGRVAKAERIEILRDSKYIIVAPLTHKASCKYGANSCWCSASLSSDWNEGFGDINKTKGSKLVYIIPKNYRMSEENEEKYNELCDLRELKEEYEDYDVDRYEELIDDIEAYDLTKIAIEYIVREGRRSTYTLWDYANNPIPNFDIYDLPIDEYAIDKIVEFCEA